MMVLTYRRPPKLAEGLKPNADRPLETLYEVRGYNREMLRLFMVSPTETRRTDDGQAVVWDLVLSGRNEYILASD